MKSLKYYLFFLKDSQTLLKALWWKLYVKGYLPHVLVRKQAQYVAKLRKKDHVNVVFLPMSVAMWKYQNVYELLKKDKRFKVYVFLTPATTITKEHRITELQAMRRFFDERNMEYIDYELEEGKPTVDIRSIVDPDILFYTQPYENVINENRRFTLFLDKLLCYSPYSFIPRNLDSTFNSTYMDLAWKLYYQTQLNKRFAEKLCANKGRNVVVSGYLISDDIRKASYQEVWKDKGRKKKRIIWAPHFTIIDEIGYYTASYFLEMAHFMQEIAVEYSDRVCFAFKPHPRLYSELCKHPEWGEEKTKAYYDFWRNNDNTQLETGDFIDLFHGSDAMIHDSGSFVVDYLYFNKPVLYDNPNIEGVKTTADEFGVKAYDMHYKMNKLLDIKLFIDDIVLGGNDPMLQERTEFYNTYLTPKDGKTVAQIIYDDIVNSIWHS